MDLTYVIADLHGAYDLLARALAAVERHAAQGEAGRRSTVFLGDYIDRGPQSREILERLVPGPPPGWRWLALKGNHEQMMIDVCDGRLDIRWWIENGGADTLRSYGVRAEAETAANLPHAHLAWVRALPPLAVDRHRVFVHAGIDPALPLEDQSEQHLLWSRERNHHGYQGRFVVHGHTPHAHGPIADGQSLNLDTLAWATGRLVVAAFDDARVGGPIDLIEVLRRA